MIDTYLQHLNDLVWNWLTKLVKIDKNQPKSTKIRVKSTKISKNQFFSSNNEQDRLQTSVYELAAFTGKKLISNLD